MKWPFASACTALGRIPPEVSQVTPALGTGLSSAPKTTPVSVAPLFFTLVCAFRPAANKIATDKIRSKRNPRFIARALQDIQLILMDLQPAEMDCGGSVSRGVPGNQENYGSFRSTA